MKLFQINAKCVSGNASVSSEKSKSRNTHLELNEIEEDLKGYIELDIEKGYGGFHLRTAALIIWSGDAQGYARPFGRGGGLGSKVFSQ